MFALIEPSGRVAQLADEKFATSPSLRWVEVPADAGISTEWTWDGKAFVAPVPVVEDQAKDYRRARKDDYIAELGEEPSSFEETVGDVLDAVIKAIYGDRAELDAMAAKIAEIKARHPKPDEARE